MADLANLSQAEAAQLLGISARTLRDRADVPRNGPRGGYVAAELMAFERGSIDRVELLPVELELVLRCAEWLGLQWEAGGFLRMAAGPRRRAGDAGLAEVLRQLLAAVEALEPIARIVDPDDDAAARAVDAQRRYARESDLRVATVCPECGLLRVGLEWVDADPKPDEDSREQTCPSCLGDPPQTKKRRRRRGGK